eukprot:TRINITY_DN11924_c1_g1_i1.p1 TRINITY_DN11924_c1_g1~~TRINITY_DN11924_c1_g1_i1.p1  ORF type:complete len:837 (+),score=314.87 TRINITY_DN11924_c1_g1_i1:99-2609(+)
MPPPRLIWAALLAVWCARPAACGWRGPTAGLPQFTTEVDRYPFGIWRVRMRNSEKPDAYEVTDVVVAEAQAAPEVADAPDAQRFEATDSTLELSKTAPVATFTAKAAHAPVELRISKDSHSDDALEVTVSFPQAERLYGIPEHAVDMSLEEGKSYRLMNLDVFHYKLDDPGGIYGVKPFMHAHSRTGTVGFFWLNSADTSVEPSKLGPGWQTKWSSKGGIYDFFFFPGPSPKDVLRQYSQVTGKMAMHPLFSLGYHQCRWNYRNEEDTLAVDEGFDKHYIPYDVIWLDIEHTDGKRYFTWDPHNFPNPKEMIEKIAAKGRKVVTITDPHIKRASGYFVHDEATANGYYVKTESGSDFEGHCWPGQSSWLDFYNEKVRNWYAEIFHYDRYKGSTPDLYTWIDMNEPSVFNAHETTMDMSAVHTRADGFKAKHRDLHNMYGFYQTMATYQGLHLRSTRPPHTTTSRPFILSRSFFSGSQRYAAVWTGDNMAKWDHLEKSIPMLLSMSLAGLPFVGADVGGFFFNPEEELLVRWYQIGAYYPFFRGHAHLETKRREPWLFGDERTAQVRRAIVNRYQLLPFIYTRFFRAHMMGESVIQPLYFEWPNDERTLDNDRQMLLGDAVMVKPVYTAGQRTVTLYLPGAEPWYDLHTGHKHGAGQDVTLDAPMEHLPALLRGGKIIPKRERVRRSSAAQFWDPYTLVVALDSRGAAEGELYADDTHSFEFEQGAFIHRHFTFANNKLTSTKAEIHSPYVTKLGAGKEFQTGTQFERVVFYGLQARPERVRLTQTPTAHTQGFSGPTSATVETIWDDVTKVLTLRKPEAWVAVDWTIDLAPDGGEL